MLRKQELGQKCGKCGQSTQETSDMGGCVERRELSMSKHEIVNREQEIRERESAARMIAMTLTEL